MIIIYRLLLINNTIDRERVIFNKEVILKYINMMKHFENPGSQFRHFSKPHAQFEVIDWAQPLLSVGLSDEGNNGVVFIETNKGSIVFKACDEVSTDLFLTKIASKLAIPTPKLRVISYDSQQFKQMMRAIEKYCHANEILYQLISRRLNRPFYQILQYIPCIQLNSIGKQRFHMIFENEERLSQIGRILAYDIIVNNSDRLSLFWEIDGNINNVLFKLASKGYTPLTKQIAKDKGNTADIVFQDIIMIDTRPTIPDKSNPEATKNYEIIIQTMSRFIQELIQFVKQQNSLHSQKLGKALFSQFNTLFLNYTSCQFNHSQLLVIGKNILICLFDFYTAFPIRAISGEIKNLKRDNKLWEDTHWNEQLDKMHISYFEGVREVLEKYLVPEEQMIRLFRSQAKFRGDEYEQEPQQEEEQKQEAIPEQLLSLFNMEKKSQVDSQKQIQDKENSKQPQPKPQSRHSSKHSQIQQPQNPPQSPNSVSNSTRNDRMKNVKATLQQKLSRFRTKNIHK